jgi:hypothetical protein
LRTILQTFGLVVFVLFFFSLSNTELSRALDSLCGFPLPPPAPSSPRHVNDQTAKMLGKVKLGGAEQPERTVEERHVSSLHRFH